MITIKNNDDVGDPWHETLCLCLFPSILEMRIDEYRVANFYLYDNELLNVGTL